MSKKKRLILGISGSLRAQSFNTHLLKYTLGRIAHNNNVIVKIANLYLPLFNEDIENSVGIPSKVLKLAELVRSADAIVISTPEYNKNLSGVLKNALDWVSRVKPQPWSGKPIIIMSAASGQSGGERAQNSLRLCLAPFDPILYFAPEVAVPDASNAFDAQNIPKSKIIREKIERQISNLDAHLE